MAYKLHWFLSRVYIFSHIVSSQGPESGLPELFSLSGMFDTLEECFVAFRRIKIPNSGMCPVSVEVGIVSERASVEERLVFPAVVTPSESCRWFIPYHLILDLEIPTLHCFLKLSLCTGRMEHVDTG